MPADIQDQVEQGLLAPRTAYEISKVEDSTQKRELAERAVAEKLTRDEVIEEVRVRRDRPARTHHVPEKIEIGTPHGRVVIFPNTPDDAKAVLIAALDYIEAKGQAA
jgi:hypothetical protein